jgi:uncharacterized membrane protein (UPF0136 family)
MSSVFAAALVLAAVPGVFTASFANGFTNVLMAVLLVIFAVRLSKSKRFMPSGLMLIITLVALVLRNIQG